jgi:hypothetical protein
MNPEYLPSAALKARQLTLLESEYPGWDITYSTDEAGHDRWQATLRRELTKPMRHLGVVETVEQDSAIGLASALSGQSAKLAQIRAGRMRLP